MKRTCIQCGKEFELTNGDIGFYKSKGYNLPKRCLECRKANREKKNPKQESTKANKKVGIWSTLGVLVVVMAVFICSQTGWLSKEEAESSNGITVVEALADEYSFQNEELLEEHFEKHGQIMGFKNSKEYHDAANIMLHSDGLLHKKESEDNDDVYYKEDTNELIIISTDGYIRTYFKPEDGIEYFERQ